MKRNKTMKISSLQKLFQIALKGRLTKPMSVLLALSVISLLSGCTAYNESFDCPAGKGIGCQSVTEVKKKLDQGAIDMPESTTEAYEKRSSGALLPPIVMQTGAVSAADSLSGFTESSGTSDLSGSGFLDKNLMIQRTAEKPLRVWIAPYQDGEGNFHEASVVHTVVRPGYWQIQPAYS